MYFFNYNGGVPRTGGGKNNKFLLFLVNNGTEVPIWEAQKIGLVGKRTFTDFSAMAAQGGNYAFETDCAVVKVFLTEAPAVFGASRMMLSFYLMLGGGLEPQKVTIQPRETSMKALGYQFQAEARFLTKDEVRTILDPGSIGVKMFCRQELPPVATLRELITIERCKPACQAREFGRRLRVRS